MNFVHYLLYFRQVISSKTKKWKNGNKILEKPWEFCQSEKVGTMKDVRVCGIGNKIPQVASAKRQ